MTCEPIDVTCEPVSKKARMDDMDGESLEKRIKLLEQEKQSNVDLLREKVRMLSLQSEPSNALILLTLDELARLARARRHIDADTYEELARQASRHQDKICIASLCLSVLSGKASDVISKAMKQCMKGKSDKTTSEVGKRDDGARPSSPMTVLYPQHYMYPMYPPHTGFGFHRPGFSGYSRRFASPTPRFGRGASGSWSTTRPVCHFCESSSHLVKDCELMKKAKKEQL